MTFGTHVAFASVLYLGGATLFGYKPDWASGLIAAVFSLLPDVDLPPSKIGRLFWFLSVPLERRFGHRTLTHSLLMLGIVAVVSYPLMWLQPLYWGCAVGGYGSHLWMDMLNVRGVDLFWPSSARLVAPGNRNWRIAVGSKAEMILLFVLLVLTVALYPLSHLGFRDALQALLKSFDIAVEQYQRQIGTHWYDLELVASDNLTLARVVCRCPVVGLWKGGLVVLVEGHESRTHQQPPDHAGRKASPRPPRSLHPPAPAVFPDPYPMGFQQRRDLAIIPTGTAVRCRTPTKRVTPTTPMSTVMTVMITGTVVIAVRPVAMPSRVRYCRGDA